MKKLAPQVLLNDLRRVFAQVGELEFNAETYRSRGHHCRATVVNYFGSWNQALAAAGLPVRRQGRPRLQDSFVSAPELISTKNLPSYRKSIPLLTHRPGRSRCLKCGDTFDSWDITKNRICGPCHKDNEGLEDEPTARLQVAL